MKGSKRDIENSYALKHGGALMKLLKAVARSGVSTCEGNDKIRKSLGHDFPGASLEGSYCRNCGCGTSFAPSYSDPDFQPCPRTRELTD